jgi:hypothetical protein
VWTSDLFDEIIWRPKKLTSILKGDIVMSSVQITGLPPQESKVPATGTVFTIMNPHGGEIYKVGSKVAIYWTGGPTLPQTVRIGLIDHTGWYEAIEITSAEPISFSPGFYQWQLPTDFISDPTHEYQIYVQDTFGSTWTYGPIFKIVA